MAELAATVAIVGRPNVGKSTLFNRLIGQSKALVDNQPGVTRDVRKGQLATPHGDVRLLDTAGLENYLGDDLAHSISDLTWRAIKAADIHVFVIDARQGVLPADFQFARRVRTLNKRIVLVANKMERGQTEVGYSESFMLGFGEPVCTSAEHRIGIESLRRAIGQIAHELEAVEPIAGSEPGHKLDDKEECEQRAVRIAIVGRPNAGKSSLINRILDRNRLLIGPSPGVTRDAISVPTSWLGNSVELFDTAGMRRKSKITERLEKLSVSDGLRAVRFAEVVIVLLDAQNPFEAQDLRLAALAAQEGRAVVVALNKWDLVENKQACYAELAADFRSALPQIRGSRLIAVSAKTGKGLADLHRQVFALYEIWNSRVSTGPLNRWLSSMIEAHPPPAYRSRRLRLRYITQVNTRPPSFVLMCSRPGKLPRSYTRYLVNGLRTHFGLAGTPIRIVLRSHGDRNPYV